MGVDDEAVCVDVVGVEPMEALVWEVGTYDGCECYTCHGIVIVELPAHECLWTTTSYLGHQGVACGEDDVVDDETKGEEGDGGVVVGWRCGDVGKSGERGGGWSMMGKLVGVVGFES
jgi:hypothetical protein